MGLPPLPSLSSIQKERENSLKEFISELSNSVNADDVETVSAKLIVVSSYLITRCFSDYCDAIESVKDRGFFNTDQSPAGALSDSFKKTIETINNLSTNYINSFRE